MTGNATSTTLSATSMTENTYQAACEEGKKVLHAAGIAESNREARLMLEHVCGTTHADYYAHGDRVLTPGEQAQYEELLRARAARKPLAYLTGSVSFMGLDFFVDERVLIPRQDTETLVEAVRPHLFDGMRFLDLCTGSGCVALSLLSYSNDTEAVATDLSDGALCVAARNAGALGLSGRVRFVCCDLFPGEKEKPESGFDLITANPPYIATAVIDTLEDEVRVYEPREALDGGEDGLAFYRRIVKEAGTWLARGGFLFTEIGYDQEQAVTALFAEHGFSHVTCVHDLAKNPRVVYGTLFGNKGTS